MPDSLLVSSEWLADHRDDPAVHIVDVREPWEYDSIGHLPGAVNIPFDSYRDADSADPGTLPEPMPSATCSARPASARMIPSSPTTTPTAFSLPGSS